MNDKKENPYPLHSDCRQLFLDSGTAHLLALGRTALAFKSLSHRDPPSHHEVYEKIEQAEFHLLSFCCKNPIAKLSKLLTDRHDPRAKGASLSIAYPLGTLGAASIYWDRHTLDVHTFARLIAGASHRQRSLGMESILEWRRVIMNLVLDDILVIEDDSSSIVPRVSIRRDIYETMIGGSRCLADIYTNKDIDAARLEQNIGTIR